MIIPDGLDDGLRWDWTDDLGSSAILVLEAGFQYRMAAPFSSRDVGDTDTGAELH
jgi:hypothetical protein